MILELLAVGLVVSAFLAVYLDDAVYSVAALAGTLILMAVLYALNDAVFVAVFQLAIAVGTLAVLFLSGEMLSEKPERKMSSKNLAIGMSVALLLAVPTIFPSLEITKAGLYSDISFPEALWNLRAVDVILQGLVIMTVALGIAIVLREKKGAD
jgi:NADH:ubiquinone oxidoreductase subunit 6 (subunit J)